jgi:hypothetical protein
MHYDLCNIHTTTSVTPAMATGLTDPGRPAQQKHDEA